MDLTSPPVLSALLDAPFWRIVAAVVALLLLQAFLSGSETALTAASRGKLKAQADKGLRGAMQALAVSDDSEKMIGALRLASNIVTILAVALATAALTRIFGLVGLLWASLGMTVLVLIFGDVLPKILSITYPEAVAIRVAPFVRPVVALFSPVVAALRSLVRAILWIFGVKADPDRKLLALREEIMGAITLGHSEGAVEKEARDRLLGALDLGRRTVDEIMRHRRQIEMIDADLSPDQIITQVLASPHTRLPIFRDSEENILGVVHAKDLLREVDKLVRSEQGSMDAIRDLDVLRVAMKPYFIPDTTALDEQMREFLKRRTHFALVVDEYGALQGLITLEDILEEIVGEISDEFDPVRRDQALKAGEDGTYLVDGAMTIRDFNRATEWLLPDDEANTIAGLVIHEAMMIPVEGQIFSFHGFRFEVVQRRENRITKLRLWSL